MTVKETVHVYSDKKSSERFYRLLPAFGLLQGVFFLGVGIISLTSKITDEDIVQIKQESEFLEWLTIRQKRYQKVIVGVYLFAAVMCIAVCSMYPSRIIKNMWLLKGGNHIAVETFSRFNMFKYLTMPLDEVSGKIMRKESTHTVPLKFKDRYAMYVMHLDKGVLHRPDLFDYLIALKREFPKN
ncbi:hypothetical protein LOTGIDRAFT_166822 [Lottia gigantea]|uniref:Transmembrane protein 223 n=1 Tax=Lottia gigantea TaxID=225164 RepID=V4BDL7_LOTGI|nr:hypothetical protein LOTGIDRAFT_166822 [Lottia gigantea]ESO86819.1 hypothetical protein LOTGIDRAFT_166822 [Lottia gigantea]